MPSKTRGRKTSRETPERQHKLPSKDEILDFIQSAPDRVGKREIARAFGIRGGNRIELKRILREMAEDGLIEGNRRRLTRAGGLPPVAVIEIVDRDQDGEFVATPASWHADEQGPPPRILVLPGGRMPGPTPGVGDRLLARLAALDEVDTSGCSYEARPIKRLARERTHLLGIYHALGRRGGVIDPVDRKQLKEWPVSPEDAGEAQDGELVRFELKRGGRYGVPRAQVLERLGAPEAEGAVSLIAIHRHGIPETFPDHALAEAEALALPSLGKRVDLRRTPLITIDPSDARDHDDAVWAAPDDDRDNDGGWVVIVAIADVACHVRPRTALDKEALKRGNSVYFPDRVVPMLPERISNDLCSLREGEDRPCLA
ncbi:MAG: RNB domain-containing ribonuclease, partial [Methyloligellaceae bacterium]